MKCFLWRVEVGVFIRPFNEDLKSLTTRLGSRGWWLGCRVTHGSCQQSGGQLSREGELSQGEKCLQQSRLLGGLPNWKVLHQVIKNMSNSVIIHG